MFYTTPSMLKAMAWADEGDGLGVVPQLFAPLLRDCSGAKETMWFYWWQAQASAFIVRLNRRTRRLLDRHRARVLRRWAGRGSDVAGDGLRPGTVALHVRSSWDKTRQVRHNTGRPEMQRLPVDWYLLQAERLMAGRQDIRVASEPFAANASQAFEYPATKFRRRRLLVNTDDDADLREIFERVGQWAAHGKGWLLASPEVLYCRANRTNKGLVARLHRFGVRSVLLESLVNLELFLEADAFVCSLASGWCRLIDLLRSTVAGKASASFVADMQIPGNYIACPPGQPLC